MSRHRVLYSILITAAIVIGADLLTDRMARNSVPRQVMRRIVGAPATIDVLGIGNSLVAAGFDPEAIEAQFQHWNRPCVAVNGGLGASGVIEHLALTRLALRHHIVKTIVYGFFDQQMSSQVSEKNSDLIGNRSMLYYQEPQLTLQYARFDTLEWLSFQLYRSSALLRERNSVWTKVERLRRTMGAVGMPPLETNEFGRKADFALLESNDRHAFSAECQRVIQSGDFLSAPVRALFEQSREHGVKVIVVEMPMHPEHVKQFYAEPVWETFRARTRAAVQRAGASYLNASAWIPDSNLFQDHLHLSKEGARQFSRLLAEHLVQNPDRATHTEAATARSGRQTAGDL